MVRPTRATPCPWKGQSSGVAASNVRDSRDSTSAPARRSTGDLSDCVLCDNSIPPGKGVPPILRARGPNHTLPRPLSPRLRGAPPPRDAAGGGLVTPAPAAPRYTPPAGV